MVSQDWKRELAPKCGDACPRLWACSDPGLTELRLSPHVEYDSVLLQRELKQEVRAFPPARGGTISPIPQRDTAQIIRFLICGLGPAGRSNACKLRVAGAAPTELSAA